MFSEATIKSVVSSSQLNSFYLFFALCRPRSLSLPFQCWVCLLGIMLNIRGLTLNDEENIEMTPCVRSTSLGLRFSSIDSSSSIKLLIHQIVIVRIQMEMLMEVRVQFEFRRNSFGCLPHQIQFTVIHAAHTHSQFTYENIPHSTKCVLVRVWKWKKIAVCKFSFYCFRFWEMCTKGNLWTWTIAHTKTASYIIQCRQTARNAIISGLNFGDWTEMNK